MIFSKPNREHKEANADNWYELIKRAEKRINEETNDQDSVEFDAVLSNVKYVNYISPTQLKEIKNGRTIASLNVRSLAKNGDKVSVLLKEAEIDILCLQEVWHHKGTFDGYALEEVQRKKRRGGGVGILIKKTLSMKLQKR